MDALKQETLAEVSRQQRRRRALRLSAARIPSEANLGKSGPGHAPFLLAQHHTRLSFNIIGSVVPFHPPTEENPRGY